jgi:hypothetical protein
MMKALGEMVNGRLYRQNQRALLLLAEAAPAVQLRCAFVELYGEGQILPALLLDDWGKEIKTIALYEWAREYGLQFPRAEMFGFDPQGCSVQYFLRDLELFSKYPSYVYPEASTPISDGVLLEAVALPGSAPEPQRIKRPSVIGGLLAYARVSWWSVRPDSLAEVDFSFLG